MLKQQRIEAFEALAKIALKVIKNEDYDALDDTNKENVVVAAVDILRQIHRKHREIDVALICSELLQRCVVDVNTEEYDVCENAANAMNYVMQLEALEEKAMCLRSDIDSSKDRILHYQVVAKNYEKALEDVESKIEAMKSDEK